MTEYPRWRQDVAKLDIRAEEWRLRPPQEVDALLQAAFVHEGDVRKTASDTPFLVHIYECMKLADEFGFDSDQKIALAYHDAVEDHPDKITFEEVARRTNEDVARIVRLATKDKTLPKSEQNAEYLKRLVDEGDERAIQVVMVDKLHNMISQTAEMNEFGMAMWSKFSAGYQKRHDYFNDILEIGNQKLSTNPEVSIYASRNSQLLEEFARRLKEFEEAYADAQRRDAGIVPHQRTTPNTGTRPLRRTDSV